MSATNKYAEVILPISFGDTYTYIIPDELQSTLQVGCRVIVPFGRGMYYTGIVQSTHGIEPKGYTVKEIMVQIDSEPIIINTQPQLWQWISDYYMCSIGDVMKAALPPGLKLESETRVSLNPGYLDVDPELRCLTNHERTIFDFLMSYNGSYITSIKLKHKTGLRNIGNVLNSMLDKGAIEVYERVNERFKTKHIKYVRLNVDGDAATWMGTAFEKVKGAQKQEAMLMTLIQLSGFKTTSVQQDLKEITRTEILENTGATIGVLKALEQKGLIEEYLKAVHPFGYTSSGKKTALPELSEAQNKALDEIHESFKESKVTLLHGVTSSGKTEIYIHLIDYVLNTIQGQVLFLVPEIALTTQLTQRLQRVFGERVVIYHSRFSDGERVGVWRRMLKTTEPCIVIGARSSVFLPFNLLKLVIVDEEHESSYKQFEPAPRYNARDTAIVLAQMYGAKTLLGSATPSIDTYYKATHGKYGLVNLHERYNNAQMPNIEVVDLNIDRQRHTFSGMFAHSTIRDVDEAIAAGNQAIIFHNRRGYAPVARCKLCQYIPKCENCDVSLTYHKRENMLSCHYCGAQYPMSYQCPSCKEQSMEIVGYGTERIADDVCEVFDKARIMRMDLDTTRNKDDYTKIISEFSEHKADILVGTQMVTKGLDFGDVTTVVVPAADSLINYPDFRSKERAFNMLMQVSGRSGRRTDTPGKVLVQTYSPQLPLFSYLKNHDYISFYNDEIEERRLYNYPPYVHIINIYFKHKEENILIEMTELYGKRLRELFGTRVFGPDVPQGPGKIQTYHIRCIMLKLEPTASMKRVKVILNQLKEDPTMVHIYRSLTIYYDVDPQ